jgi:hypothetical protein
VLFPQSMRSGCELARGEMIAVWEVWASSWKSLAPSASVPWMLPQLMNVLLAGAMPFGFFDTLNKDEL